MHRESALPWNEGNIEHIIICIRDEDAPAIPPIFHKIWILQQGNNNTMPTRPPRDRALITGFRLKTFRGALLKENRQGEITMCAQSKSIFDLIYIPFSPREIALSKPNERMEFLICFFFCLWRGKNQRTGRGYISLSLPVCAHSQEIQWKKNAQGKKKERAFHLYVCIMRVLSIQITQLVHVSSRALCVTEKKCFKWPNNNKNGITKNRHTSSFLLYADRKLYTHCLLLLIKSHSFFFLFL